jgi:hypothetical protein
MPNKIEQTINDGFAVLIYPNALGTATIALIDGEDWGEVETAIAELPEDQIVDVHLPAEDEKFADGVAQVKRKIDREGEYADWDERIKKLGLDN